MLHIAQALAQRGYVAFSIDYRLAPEHPYPAALDDVRVALKWLDAHADEYDIDRGRLVLWGYSSGAQLAGMVAAALPPDTPPIAAAVPGAIPTDRYDERRVRKACARPCKFRWSPCHSQK